MNADEWCAVIPGICAVGLLSNCISISGQRLAAEIPPMCLHTKEWPHCTEKPGAVLCYGNTAGKGLNLLPRGFHGLLLSSVSLCCLHLLCLPKSQSRQKILCLQALSFHIGVYRAFVTSTSHFRSKKLHTHTKNQNKTKN